MPPCAIPCLGRPLWHTVAEILEPQAQVCSPSSLGGGPHTPGLHADVGLAGQHRCRKALPTQSLGPTPAGWVSEAQCPSLLSWADGALCLTVALQAFLLPSLDNPHLLGQAVFPHSPPLLPGPASPGPLPTAVHTGL